MNFTDLGCGSGKLLLQTAWLAPWIRSLQGVEILPELCDLAQEALDKANTSTTLAASSSFSSSEAQQDFDTTAAAAAAAVEDAQFCQALHEFAQRHELPLDPAESSPSVFSSSDGASSATSLDASPVALSLPPPPSSMRVRVHAADILTSAPSWLPHTNLLYVCATAFSESLRRNLFTLITKGVSVPSNTPTTAAAAASPSTNTPPTTAASAATARPGARSSTRLHLPLHALVVLVSYPIPADLNYSGSFVLLHHLRDVAMSWGRCSVYVYRKVHARSAENNILRSFRKT